MNERHAFEEGYKEGWRLLMGNDVPTPEVPSRQFVGSLSPYRQGMALGMRDAEAKLSKK